MNRASRRAAMHDIKQGMKQGWQPWEWREVANHPKAPKGLIKACLNNIYSVQFFHQYCEWGKIDHLMVRRHDAKPIRSWGDMQRIKNELVGSDAVAIEVYPAEIELVDQANIYHLWVLPKGMSLPFGLHPINQEASA